MHLNELAIGVASALLEERRLGGAGADHGIRGVAEDSADSAGAENDGVRGERADFRGAQIHGADAARDASVVENSGEERPAFEFLHAVERFVTADLLIERVQQLLAGGGAGERGAIDRACRRSGENRAGPRECG